MGEEGDVEREKGEGEGGRGVEEGGERKGNTVRRINICGNDVV